MSKELQEAIIQDLKKVAVELGRAPTRLEYHRNNLGSYSEKTILRIFGSFTTALTASGLNRLIQKKNPLEVNLENHLHHHNHQESYKDKHRSLREMPASARILAIGDCHFPFIHSDSLNKIYQLADILKPNIIIQMGDLYDMFSQSKFPRSQLVYRPDEEINLARSMASEMWRKLLSIQHNAKCIQILGNHDIRPIKRLIERCPELEPFLEFNKWFEFNGVDLVSDYREVTQLTPSISCHHGYMSKIGDLRDNILSNLITAHSHVGGVVYRHIHGKTLWELNAGYIGDPESKALGYTPTKVNKWTHGCGFVDSLGPRFVPFN